MLAQSARAALTVMGVTLLLLFIGRDRLGETVVALLYVLAVGWSTSRWGQAAGTTAAVVAALTFDFFFIPPYLTFTVGSLDGWLALAVFLLVAVAVVGRIQAGLSRALAAEREAYFMYELSAALAGSRTQSGVAHTLARHLQQMYQAAQAEVIVHGEGPSPAVVARESRGEPAAGHPDQVVPILNAWGLAGVIRLWRGYTALPPTESRLLQNFASQAGQALERTRLAEAEDKLRVLARPAAVN
jgi:two-component system sensor histidine kinase KdpD